MMKNVITSAIAAIALMGSASSAHAWLDVCNQNSGRTLKWSHVISDPTCYQPATTCSGKGVCGTDSTGSQPAFRSSGWWVIEPGACVRVFAGDARRYFYYYVVSTDGVLSLPPPSYETENVFVTFHGNYNGCTSNGAHVFSDTFVRAPHYKFGSLDADARIYL